MICARVGNLTVSLGRHFGLAGLMCYTVRNIVKR